MIKWTTRLLNARDFFRGAHDSIGQKRKYSGAPYWVHTEETAETLSEITSNEDFIIGELGHDYGEDVVPFNSKYTMQMAHDLFGATAYQHIFDLTDVYTKEAFPQYNRAQRKEMERNRLGGVRVTSKNGKLADILSNTGDIVTNDPNFAKTYIREIYMLLLELRGSDQNLYQRAMNQVLEGIQKLKLDIPAKF